MTRRLVAIAGLVAVLVAPGCGSSPDWPHVRPMTREHPEASLTEGWLNPKTLVVNGRDDAPDEDDMVLAGVFSGWLFTPSGDVQGALHTPPADAKVIPARLQLTRRTIHLIEEEGAVAPEPPFLEGRFDPETRLFYPSSPVVITERS